MTPTRRRVLTSIGGLAGASLLAAPATAASTERVLVHPESGLLGDVVGLLDSIEGTIAHEYENFEFVAAELPESAVEDLEGNPSVALVEQDPGIGIPDEWDPSLLDLLAPTDCSAHEAEDPSWGWERIGADAVDETGSGVDVGILDTGIHADHCDLEVADGANYADGVGSGSDDGHGHGTHVAGIVGARENELGVLGVAPEAQLHAIKVLDDEGNGSHGALVAGIDHCMSNDVPLISMSLGGSGRSEALHEAITEAHGAGHLVLAAAGNEGNDRDGDCEDATMTYPATHGDVLAVSAMGADDTLAEYSSVGPGVDLMAPGTNVRSTYADGGYAEASGTSMACPFVTGVAALVWEGDGPGPNEAVAERLRSSAASVLGTCEEGDGLVDAAAAVEGERAPGDGSVVGDDGVVDRVEGLPGWTVPGVAAGGVVGYGAMRVLRR